MTRTLATGIKLHGQAAPPPIDDDELTSGVAWVGVTPRGPDIGQLDLGDLVRRWQQLEVIAARVDEVDHAYASNQLLTARRMDEASPAGHRAYISARGMIDAGMEHMEALQALLAHHGASPRAPWTLVRASFEAGFWASWVLDPDSGPERRARGLRVEVRDFKQRAPFHAALLRTQPEELARRQAADAETEKLYRGEAEAIGLPWSVAANYRSINIVDELERLSVIKDMGANDRGLCVACWRALSGLQHGYVYALDASSDVHSSTKIPGGQRRLVTISDKVFQSFAGITNAFLASAMDLFIRRCTSP